MAHLCHSPGCSQPVDPKKLFCRPHWFALPGKVRNAIWFEYRDGQEITKTPTLRYLAVQRLACAYSVFKPYDEKSALEAIRYLGEAVGFSREAVKQGLGDPLANMVPKDWPVKKARGRAKRL